MPPGVAAEIQQPRLPVAHIGSVYKSRLSQSLGWYCSMQNCTVCVYN